MGNNLIINKYDINLIVVEEELIGRGLSKIV